MRTAALILSLLLVWPALGQVAIQRTVLTTNNPGVGTSGQMLVFTNGGIAWADAPAGGGGGGGTNTDYDTLNIGTINLTNALGVASGGTGKTNLTAGRLWSGNGTNALDEVILGSGLSLSGSAGSTRTLTASGGSSAFTTLTVTNSTTNAIVLDPSAYSLIRVLLLTNANVVLTNATSLVTRAQIQFQQDTNGSRLVESFRVAGGLLQTNSSMQPTTNANALDMLEVMPGFFTTNLIAWWPQNFQPRVAFTNSLAGGGGGGGGGSGAWIDVNDSASTDSNGNIESVNLHWTAITLTSGTAKTNRLYIRNATNPSAAVKVGLYDGGGNLVASGSATIPGTGYLNIPYTVAASVSAGTYYVAWIGDSGSTDNQIGYQNGVGTLNYQTAGISFNTLPSTLPAAEGSVTRKYAVGVWVQ